MQRSNNMNYQNSFDFNSDYSSTGINCYKIPYKIFILMMTIAMWFLSFFLFKDLMLR